MRRRLYFMVPDVASARQIRDELLLARIEDGHIHVMARDGVPLPGLHEASILQKTDFVHGAETGLAVGGGIGAWRLRTVYEDEEDPEDDRQRIRIEPIFDADSSVFFDLNAKRQDKSDARYCYVVTSMTRQSYKETWGDDPSTWPKEVHQYEFDWATPDVVFVAEYYRVEDRAETVRIFRDISGEEERYRDEELTEETLAELAAIGSVEQG